MTKKDIFDMFDPLDIDPTPEEEDTIDRQKVSEDVSEDYQLIPPPKKEPMDLGPVNLAEKLASENEVPEIHRVSKREMYLSPKVSKGMTAEQKKLLNDAVKDIALHGAAAAAMICRGEGVYNPVTLQNDGGCPYLLKCPLYRAGHDLPIEEDCPVEISILEHWTEGYMRELGVNPHNVNNAYDAQSAILMAGLQLQINRARWGEAINPTLEQTVTSTGPGGMENVTKVGNYNTDYREKASKLLQKFARDSMQTRDSKVRLLRSGLKDASKHSADVHERLQKLEQATSIEEEISVTDREGLITKLKRTQRFDTEKREHERQREQQEWEDDDE